VNSSSVLLQEALALGVGCGLVGIHILEGFGLEVKSVDCVCIRVVSESYQYSGAVSIDFRFNTSLWVQLIHRVVVEYEAETLSRSHSTAIRKNKASETLFCVDRNYLPDQCHSVTVTRTKTVIVRLAMQCTRACHDAILLSALRSRDKSHALLHCGYLSLTEVSAYPLPRQLLELLRPTVLRAMSVPRVTTLAHGRAYTASNETIIRASAGYSPVASI
jgi:hypothetical protein